MTAAVKVKKQDHRTCRPAPRPAGMETPHVVQEAPDRQSRRDRHPHRARGGRARHRDGRRSIRRTTRFAARARADEAVANSRAAARAAYLDIAAVVAAAKAPAATPCIRAMASSAENAAFARGLRRGEASPSSARRPSARTVRRQGRARGRWRSAATCRCCRAPSGPSTLAEIDGVLHEARQGRGDRDQGDGRRRRARHAAGRTKAPISRRPYARCPSEAKAAFGNGDALCRAADPPGAPHRGADRRRRPGRDLPLWERECSLQRRQPEDRRAGAQPVAQRGAARAASSRRPSQLAEAAAYAASAPSSSWSTAGETALSSSRPIRGCRSSTPSPRRCSGLDLVRAQLRSLPAHAGLARLAQGASRSRAATPCSCASTWRPWPRRLGAAGRRHARRVRAAVGARRARR